jgi:putative transposase
MEARRADMANTFVQQRIHLVWSTKGRQALLASQNREALWGFLGRCICNRGGVMFIAGGMEDHVHVYTEYPKTLALSQFVNSVKAISSKWLRDEYGDLEGFHWQSGYAAFSVDKTHDERLQEYIRNQEEHHRRMSFQEEYLKLLKRFGIPYDPRYVLD